MRKLEAKSGELKQLAETMYAPLRVRANLAYAVALRKAAVKMRLDDIFVWTLATTIAECIDEEMLLDPTQFASLCIDLMPEKNNVDGEGAS